MSDPGDVKDTIPRIHQLVPHMTAQLVGLLDGATFERARLRYVETVDYLVAEGKGRKTASRVGDRDAYWAPTTAFLEEAMRLGFVEKRPLPSARKYLDAYRTTPYGLTDAGRDAAELAQDNPARFMDLLSNAVVRVHPYFSQLLQALEENPLLFPEVSEGRVESFRKEARSTDDWAGWATKEINRGPAGKVATHSDVREEIVTALRRRFGANPTERPSSKSLAEALTDACAVASLRSRGLGMGATELKALKVWGSQFLVLDESRQVPQFDGHEVMWGAADLTSMDGVLQIARRGLGEFDRRVAEALVAAYRRQAKDAASSLAAPYLAIHRVRAEAAFSTRVTRALVDMVLEQVATGKFADLGVQVFLHLGGGDQPPPSEPPYRRGGSRMYEMTMIKQRALAPTERKEHSQ